MSQEEICAELFNIDWTSVTSQQVADQLGVSLDDIQEAQRALDREDR